MISCSAWRLYVIVDPAASEGRDLAEVAAAAIRGGADAIQLRDKAASARRLLAHAERLLPLTRMAGIPLVINDRVDIARAIGADGVHLGQDDLPIKDARGILGPARLIGKSTHSLEQALAAQAEGVDYIGFGPIFPTPTKPDYPSLGTSLIRQVTTRIQLPVICIGGIDGAALEQAIDAGARCVAVVRAVCSAPDPESSARNLKQILTQFVPTTSAPHL